MAALDVDVLRNRLRACINAILQELNSPNFDSDSHDSVFFRVESLYNTIARFDGAVGIDNNIVSYIRQVRDCLSSHSPTSSARVAEKLFTGNRGRPKYVVPQEQVEFLIERHFSVPEISKLLGVSTRTVERRMSQYGLSIRGSYDGVNDNELDDIVTGILKDFPNAGYKRMTGLLLARGIRLQQSRIRSAMQRVNPEGCLLRSLELNVLHRRKYQVYGPLALWHIDGNHKLIRYERWVICCWAIKLWVNVTSAKTVLRHWCKVIHDSLGLWIPRCGFRIEDPGFWIPRQWNLDPDSKAHDSGLFQQKFSGFQISLEKLPQIPDPKIRINLHGANCKYCWWGSGSTPLKV